MLEHALSETYMLRITLFQFLFNCFSQKLMKEDEKAHNFTLNAH